jgi:hypothetical protein
MNSITTIAQTMLRHLHGADVKAPDEAKIIATAIQAWTLVGGSVEAFRQAIAELRHRYGDEGASDQRWPWDFSGQCYSPDFARCAHVRPHVEIRGPGRCSGCEPIF